VSTSRSPGCAAIGRAKALAGAAGLSPGQHRFWAAAVADEARRLGVLNKELTTERAWRSQLGLNELGLDKDAEGARPGVGGGHAPPALVLPDGMLPGDRNRRGLNHHKRDCAG
jgi:hypothetical protein